jgi:hypothetical protein
MQRVNGGPFVGMAILKSLIWEHSLTWQHFIRVCIYLWNLSQWVKSLYIYTGVPGGTVSVLTGHCIGNSKQKIVYVLVFYSERFRDRAVSLYSERDITYCFSYRYLLSKWQSWYSLLSIIYFRKFQRQHQCTLQLVWGSGVLLVCTVYSVLCNEMALSQKPFGLGHLYVYLFSCLKWPIVRPPRILHFPPGTFCI